MRIFMENSSHHLRNAGDLAMLQAAVLRLQEIWPNAHIHAVTDAPEILAEYCPGVSPVPLRGRREWLASRRLCGRIHSLVKPSLSSAIEEAEEYVLDRLPSLAQMMTEIRMGIRKGRREEIHSFLDTVLSSDLVVASGGGFITDSFEAHALNILNVLDLGIRHKKTTALLGQGIGPISSTKLLKKTRHVLPHIDLIGVREKTNGLKYLEECDCRAEKTKVTGDDAIEIAWKMRDDRIGQGIGINLRCAVYSEIDLGMTDKVRGVIHRVARRHEALLVPIPISYVERESDVTTVVKLMEGYPPALSAPMPGYSLSAILAHCRLCRVAVTGSYHCGVFALAQGIPAVGLARSQYYRNKFEGLSAQFDGGMEIVDLDDPGFEERFQEAMDKAWKSAPEMRTTLLRAAERQIDSGRAAYAKIKEIFDWNRGGVAHPGRNSMFVSKETRLVGNKK
jgi:polysaccharide pyruvyl transferase WcaK-like protein